MEESNIILLLISEFTKNNFWMIIALFIVSLAINMINVYGISYSIAQIYEVIKQSNINKIWNTFYILCGMFVIFQLGYFIYYSIETILVNKMKSWGRFKLLDWIMSVNDKIFSDINFVSLNNPIHRVADMIAWAISDVLGYFLPNLILVLVVSFFFFKMNYKLALMFFISNIIVFFVFYYSFSDILHRNERFEKINQHADKIMIDILNNFDKVVHRGEKNNESSKMENLFDQNAERAINYYNSTHILSSIMVTVILLVFLLSIYILLKMVIQKKISPSTFIASVTILMLYREKLCTVIEQMPGFIGYIGRMNVALRNFKHVNKHILEIMKTNISNDSIDLNFDNIRFDNISYKYNTNKYIFKDKSLNINIENNKIVGITGPSGSGKSTIMKLLIGMYPVSNGDIYIDGKNIKTISSSTIRKNMTYVTQNSKLFDKKVIENMMYGCIDMEKCSVYLNKIMTYPKIAALYKNMDINKKRAGQLGENLSGGQRQVVNMISGFINPSKILILDEPTNALDPELKNEVIQLIKDFKQYKKTIFIVTHDKDVFEIFDDEIKLAE